MYIRIPALAPFSTVIVLQQLLAAGSSICQPLKALFLDRTSQHGSQTRSHLRAPLSATIRKIQRPLRGHEPRVNYGMKSKYLVRLFLWAMCFRRLNPFQALTRTLTTLYTITLLSLLTAVQLNVLGRSRYIDSVRVADRAERAREQIPDFSLTGILAREAVAKIMDVEGFWPAWILGESEDGEEDDEGLDAIPEETELRFLTLSWWVLHVGWKDVAARVRSSVESVFDE